MSARAWRASVAAVEDERRRGRERLEADVDELRRVRATLRDLAIDSMFDGDVVAVTAGAATWKGVITHVGDDVVTLATGRRSVDLVLSLIETVRVVRPRSQTGRSLRSRFPATLAARLREYALVGERVTLAAGATTTRGRVVIVGRHYVEIDSRRRRTVVRLDAVTWVAAPCASDSAEERSRRRGP